MIIRYTYILRVSKTKLFMLTKALLVLNICLQTIMTIIIVLCAENTCNLVLTSIKLEFWFNWCLKNNYKCHNNYNVYTYT